MRNDTTKLISKLIYEVRSSLINKIKMKLAAQGPHDELLSKNSLYAQMAGQVRNEDVFSETELHKK